MGVQIIVEEDTKKIRDSQKSRIYAAGDRASRIILRRHWTPTFHTDAEVAEFMNRAISHPNILARWGAEKELTLSITDNPKVKNEALAQVQDAHIFMSRKSCNEILLLHELAHFYEVSKPEADHGPGYAAIFHYFVSNILGVDAGEVLLESYQIHKVKFDYMRLPEKEIEPVSAINSSPIEAISTEITQVTAKSDSETILKRTRTRLGSFTKAYRYAKSQK